MTRPARRRGGRGDRLAPAVALLIVVALAWSGARAIRRAGWDVPWGPAGRNAARGASLDHEAPSVPRAQTGAAARGSEPGARHDESSDMEPAKGADGDDVVRLRARHLDLPVLGIDPRGLRSDFHDPRGGGEHEALDLLAPRGQPIVAVEDGTIAKLFTSRRGGLTIYQFDPGLQYAYYYAHLDGYATNLVEGAAVKRGDVLGYVGTTGNAPEQTPHLHFAIFRLGPERHWWQGTAVDPFPVFRQGGCGASASRDTSG